MVSRNTSVPRAASERPGTLGAPAVLALVVIGAATAAVLSITGSPMLYLGAVGGLILTGIVLHNARLGMYLTIASVPLEAAGRLGNLLPNIDLSLPKIFVLVTLVAWLLEVMMRRLPLTWTTELTVLTAYALAGAISLVDALEFSLGYPALFRYLSTVVFYFLLVNLIRTRQQFVTAVSLLVGVSVLTFGFAIAQRYIPGFTFADRLGWDRAGAVTYGVEMMMLDAGDAGTVARSSGVSVHAILMAVNTVFIVPLLFAALRTFQTFWQQTAIWLAIAVCIAANFTSYSRTGLLILGAILALLIYRKLIKITPLHVVAAVIVAACAVPFLPESLVNRVFSFQSYTVSGSESLRERVRLLEAGWNAFLDHPWNGMGMETTYRIFDYYEYPDQGAVVTVHNGYLQVALELGLPGLILLLAFFYVTYRRFGLAEQVFTGIGDRSMAMVARALRTSLIAFFLVGFTVDFLRIGFKNMWTIMAFAPVLHLIAQRQRQASAPPLSSPDPPTMPPRDRRPAS
ncbi:MAG TPA: O-antigen ligase family protein [Vicinamibacterales bacterium]|nr:O-antigen ligase family protein [Vicinamibacterales bacterium]